MPKTIFELGEAKSRSEYYNNMDSFLNRCYANLLSYEAHYNDIQEHEMRELKYLHEILADAKHTISFYAKAYEVQENVQNDKESD